ncbi:uncharacterized protein DS421_10g294040 [Arachis hypogaea]|nr:uncharacterized protein DS421_10g294040 [Arachis hypogaea]
MLHRDSHGSNGVTAAGFSSRRISCGGYEGTTTEVGGSTAVRQNGGSPLARPLLPLGNGDGNGLPLLQLILSFLLGSELLARHNGGDKERGGISTTAHSLSSPCVSHFSFGSLFLSALSFFLSFFFFFLRFCVCVYT